MYFGYDVFDRKNAEFLLIGGIYAHTIKAMATFAKVLFHRKSEAALTLKQKTKQITEQKRRKNNEDKQRGL